MGQRDHYMIQVNGCMDEWMGGQVYMGRIVGERGKEKE